MLWRGAASGRQPGGVLYICFFFVDILSVGVDVFCFFPLLLILPGALLSLPCLVFAFLGRNLGVSWFPFLGGC